MGGLKVRFERTRACECTRDCSMVLLSATCGPRSARLSSVSPSNVMRGVIYARIEMDRGVAEAGVVA